MTTEYNTGSPAMNEQEDDNSQETDQPIRDETTARGRSSIENEVKDILENANRTQIGNLLEELEDIYSGAPQSHSNLALIACLTAAAVTAMLL